MHIRDFELTDDEMMTMRDLDTGKTKHDPDARGVGEYLIQNYPIED